MRTFELDVHTHTLVSGHAYNTLTEMVRAAADKGLKLLGITEHGRGIPGTCDDLYFINMRCIPRELFGVRLMMGAELNIVDYDGTVDVSPRVLKALDLRIAGIHAPYCYTFGTAEQNTAAILGAIRDPAIDIISHPDDGRLMLDYEAVVRAAVEHHTLLEINNNSVHVASRTNVPDNVRTLLRLCREHRHPIVVNSDAHFMTDVGKTDVVMPLLEETHFPEELILNCDAERFLAWIAENRRTSL